MVSKEQLLEINGLNLSGRIYQMNDVFFQEYCQALNTFVDRYPEREIELRNALDKKDKEMFTKILKNISDLLMLIYAEDLAQGCANLGSAIHAMEEMQFEAHTTYLLTTISGLSINIQMALSDERSVNTADKQALPKNLPDKKPGSKIVLAVDDVPLVLSHLNSILKQTNHTFVGFTSGLDALKYIDKHDPDLFILDIEMPDMDGYTLAQELRDHGQIAPVIFLTGNATKDYVFKAIQAGAADFVVKPVNKEQVLEKIDKFLLL